MTMSPRQSFSPSPAVESVHTDDPYGTHGPCSRRCPFVLDEEHAEYDQARLERICEHAPAQCLDCRQLADWMIW
jgi:hypothetical protein